MKDTIITKIIPKTHKSVLLFLLFTFFLGFFIFIALLEGFQIDRLTLSGVKVEKLYLKWDNSLHIKAAKLDFSDIKSDGTPLTLKPLSKLPKYLHWGESLINSIQIDIIQYKDIKGSLSYQKNNTGTITLEKLNTARCMGRFDLNSTDFRLLLPTCKIQDANISARLNIDLTQQLIRSDIGLSLPNTPNITASFYGDTDTLNFKMDAKESLTTIKPLIDFLHLDPDVTPWIVEYAKASSIRLNHLNGVFHYDQPNELIKTLNADATVINGEYTFASRI